MPVRRRQRDTHERAEIGEREEVGRHAGVNAGSPGIIGLRKDVRQREQAGEPERRAERHRLEVLPQAVPLEREIADAERDQRERRVEDRNGVRNREPERGEER